MKALMNKKNHLCLLISAALCMPTGAWAKDYFDPSLLSLLGESADNIDLTVFETKGNVAEGDYLVAVLVNRNRHGDHMISFKKNQAGSVIPVITPAMLRQWGVNTPVLPEFQQLDDNMAIDDLALLIPQAAIEFNLQELSLQLSIPQIAMASQVQGYVDPDLWDQGVPAVLVNYNMSAGHNSQSVSSGGTNQISNNFFALLNLGANYDAWRLRSNMTYSYQESHGQTEFSTSTVKFNNTYLQRDIQSLRADLALGEIYTGSDVFDSFPFKGAKLQSSTDMLPYSERGFAPLITGIAQTNARITVSQNGSVVYQTYVAPGPFSIADLYQTGSSGDLTVTITESDGTVKKQIIPYSSLPNMLRAGAMQYEFSLGQFNGYQRDSIDANFMLGSFSYGLPYDVTTYGGGVLAKNYFSAAVGIGISLGDFGAFSTDITKSRAKPLQVDDWQDGMSYRVRYAKSLLSTGTTIDLAAYRYSTKNFYSFSDFNNNLSNDTVSTNAWFSGRKRSSIQLRLNQNLWDYGSFYLSASREDYWGNNSVNKNISVGYSGNYQGITYNISYSQDRIKQDNKWPINHQLAFNMQIPFSLFSRADFAARNSISYQVNHANDGVVRQQIGLNGTTSDGRVSYLLSQGWSNRLDQEQSNINLSYQGNKGNISGGYSYSSRYSSVNVVANGGAILHPAGFNFSQMLGNTIAIVNAPGAENVRVMNGNVTANNQGQAVVGYLAPYQLNEIILDPATLPNDIDIDQTSVKLYPTKGAVVMANFATKIGYQALITVIYEDKTVPFGAIAMVNSSDAGTNPNTGIVGDGGQVYLSGLPEQGSLLLKWGKGVMQQCMADFDLRKVNPIFIDNPIRQLDVNCQE